MYPAPSIDARRRHGVLEGRVGAELHDQPVAEGDQMPGVNRYLRTAAGAAPPKADIGDHAVAVDNGSTGLDLEPLPWLVGVVPEDRDPLVAR